MPTQEYTAARTTPDWTLPSDAVTGSNVVVECVGGGGAGGGGGNTGYGGSGGGGGAYSRRTWVVGTDITAGNSYTAVVGAAGSVSGNDVNGGPGGDTYFLSNTSTGCLAKGGLGGLKAAASAPAGQAGGQSSAGYADASAKFSGATGAAGGSNGGGAGGVAAANNADSTATGAGTNPAGPGGPGSAGATSGSASAPASGYGGAGGGGNDAVGSSGGAGYCGYMLITYTVSVTGDTLGGSAVLKAAVTDETDGGSAILKKAWTSDTSGGSADLHFTYASSLTGLSANQTYHVRAYATSGGVTAYGEEVDFFSTKYGSTSGGSAELESSDEGEPQTPVDTDGGSAILLAVVTDETDGGSAVLLKQNTDDTEGGTAVLLKANIDNTDGGTAVLLAELYGETSGGSAELSAGLTGNTQGGSAVLLKANLDETDGGSAVLQGAYVGSCYGSAVLLEVRHHDNMGGSAELLEAGQHYDSVLTALTRVTHYYVRAYATNPTGTSYGEVVEFDTIGGDVDTLGGSAYLQGTSNDWVTGSAVLLAEHGYEAGGSAELLVIGGFASYLTSLEATTHYYVRAYATSDDGTGYGEVVEFDTTAIAVAEAGGSAVLLGPNSLSVTGSADLVKIGFTSSLTGLSYETHYYVRAYATSEDGTSYGNVVQFDTLGDPGLAYGSAHLVKNDNTSDTLGGSADLRMLGFGFHGLMGMLFHTRIYGVLPRSASGSAVLQRALFGDSLGGSAELIGVGDGMRDTLGGSAFLKTQLGSFRGLMGMLFHARKEPVLPHDTQGGSAILVKRVVGNTLGGSALLQQQYTRSCTGSAELSTTLRSGDTLGGSAALLGATLEDCLGGSAWLVVSVTGDTLGGSAEIVARQTRSDVSGSAYLNPAPTLLAGGSAFLARRHAVSCRGSAMLRTVYRGRTVHAERQGAAQPMTRGGKVAHAKRRPVTGGEP